MYFLAVPLVGPAMLLISMCCVFSLLYNCWAQTDVYVLCIFLAVPFVGLVVLSMCCVFSCCATGWSRSAADIYVLCFFLAVQLVGLKQMSMCCVFSLLCDLLVS